MSAEARQRLSSLGYVSTPATPAAGVAAPDPKRMAPLFERLLDGNRALARGEPDRRGGIAREVLAEDAGNALRPVWCWAGRCWRRAGHREAIDALRGVSDRGVPGSADAHHWMALAQLRLGDRAGALAEEEATLALDPAARRRHRPARRPAVLERPQGRGRAGASRRRDRRPRQPCAARVAGRSAGRRRPCRRGRARVPARARGAPQRRAARWSGSACSWPAPSGSSRRWPRSTRALEIDPSQDEARFERAVVL